MQGFCTRNYKKGLGQIHLESLDPQGYPESPFWEIGPDVSSASLLGLSLRHGPMQPPGFCLGVHDALAGREDLPSPRPLFLV